MPITLITGGNKGIGLETARQLARKGHTVLIGARDPKKGQAAVDALKHDGLTAHAVTLDVTSDKSIAAAVADVTSRFKALDVLINNAGVMLDPSDTPPSATSQEVLRKSFDSNVFGLIAVTQAFLPLLRRSSAGRIVNLSSVLGSMAEHQDPSSSIYGNLRLAYNTSKAAVNMFTVQLAQELKDTKIKVNAAHPGWVKTDMGGEEAPLEVEDGARTSVRLATLPNDGPTGGYFYLNETLRW